MSESSVDAASMRSSQQQLLNMLNSVAEGIYCVNLSGECTFCNSRCLQLLRYERPSELLGRNMHDLIHHTHRDGRPYHVKDCNIYKAYVAGSQVHVDDEVFWRKDGTRFDAEYWSYPIMEDGEIAGAVVSFVDISAKREEGAHREHLAQLVEASSDAIISKDRNGVITSWNRGASELFGYDAEEAVGQTARIILPPDRTEEEPEIRAAVAAGRELKQFEVRRRRKNGELRNISLTISPIRNADRELIGFSFIERDITDRRRSQDELIKAKSAAEHAESLADAANRSRAEFLANVSHELRTPMNAILGMLQLALDERLDPTVLDYLKTAKSSADSLLELVNEILDFSKLESGKFEINNVPFNLRETIDNSARSLAPQAGEKGLEVLCEVDSVIPPQLIGDPLRIQQVITNLLSNAIKFTDTGEIVVRVKETRKLPGEVRLSFSVTDTGIGIKPEDQERIFSPFAQVDMSLTRRQHGTGLGLSICRELLSLMGGKLKLKSQLGKGSRFYFDLTLPVVDDAAATDHQRAELVQNLKVLVVDDNATNLRILEKILVSWSMQPIVAEDAAQALRILEQADDKEHDIALAIVDGVMPGVDGFELASTVAKTQGVGNPPIVIMQSAADLARYADKKVDAPVANYLIKPVSHSEMLDTIIDTLNLYEHQTTTQPEAVIDKAQASQPLTVLLVEDLPANQKVVQSILEKRGHRVMVADNGQLALESLRRKGSLIDVVLMDVQMPVMDGLQATAAIRALPEKAMAEIPIIAMTAHAMQGDREACLAAGMDAYIAKPLEVQQLVDMVEAIVHSPASVKEKSGQSQNTHVTDPATTIVQDRLKLVDLDFALNRLGGDSELFKEFVGIFVQDSPELVNQIALSIENSDHVQLEKNAHALKGLMSNFGAEPCVQLMRRFEQAGRQRDIASIAGQQAELKHLYQKLCDELTGFQD